jgi:WXG100 family type VII secretion target
MTVIRIDTAQVESTGSQFISKRGELEALVSQAKSMMTTLQGQFTGTRAQRIFSEWEGMQPSLQSAIQTMEQAGTLLKRAATDFGQADMGL